MAGYVYVGRRRHRGWMAVWQLLTLGVYGRVWLYRTLRDLDGHAVLFLERRLYLPLLLLPFLGAFLVKRRVVHLTHGLLRHDVTSPPLPLRSTVLLGLVPWAPLLHLRVQRVLNHHWKMHTKEEELVLKEAELVRLQRRARTPEAQAAARDLEAEVARRRKELDDLRFAAVALREAEATRRAIEREGHGAPTRRGTVRKFWAVARSRAKRPPASQPGGEPAGEAPLSSGAGPSDEAAPAADEEREGPGRGRWRGWVPKLRKDPGSGSARAKSRRLDGKGAESSTEEAPSAKPKGKSNPDRQKKRPPGTGPNR